MLRSITKWLFLFLLLLDLGFLNYKIYTSSQTPSPIPSSDCPNSCVAKINQAVASIPTPTISDPLPTSTQTPNRPPIIQTKKSRIVSYLPVPGSGETLSNSWVNLSGTEFNFNTADYSDLKEAYFEANLKLRNGNGLAYIRLFDITAGIEVWGSEVQTSSQDFTVVVSGKLTLRSGNHLYRVQAKSLTADTTVFNSGRIKLISEN